LRKGKNIKQLFTSNCNKKSLFKYPLHSNTSKKSISSSSAKIENKFGFIIGFFEFGRNNLEQRVFKNINFMGIHNKVERNIRCKLTIFVFHKINRLDMIKYNAHQ